MNFWNHTPWAKPSNLPKASVLCSYNGGEGYYQFSVSASSYLSWPLTQRALSLSDSPWLPIIISCELLNNIRKVSSLTLWLIHNLPAFQNKCSLYGQCFQRKTKNTTFLEAKRKSIGRQHIPPAEGAQMLLCGVRVLSWYLSTIIRHPAPPSSLCCCFLFFKKKKKNHYRLTQFIKCKINAILCLLNAFYLNKFTNQMKYYTRLGFQAKLDENI